jgi:hypothetical protein
MTDERHNASFMSKKKCLLGVNHTDESETHCRDSNRDQLGIETRLENRLGLKHGTFGPKIMQTFWGGESPSRSLLHGRLSRHLRSRRPRGTTPSDKKSNPLSKFVRSRVSSHFHSYLSSWWGKIIRHSGERSNP